MSDTDPYAAAEIELPVEALETVKPVVVAKAPVKDALEAPEGTAASILAWVDGDPEKAEAALKAELAGQKRTALTNKLKAIVG